MSVIREILDSIDQSIGLAAKTVFSAFADRLIVEGARRAPS